MLPQLHSNPVSINIGLAASFLRRKIASPTVAVGKTTTENQSFTDPGSSSKKLSLALLSTTCIPLPEKYNCRTSRKRISIESDIPLGVVHRAGGCHSLRARRRINL